MIRYNIKVCNDHATRKENFECEELFLSSSDPTLLLRVQQVVDKFKSELNEPVEEVKITATMIV